MYNIKDAIFNVAAAWGDIQVSNLKNGSNKLSPVANDGEPQETDDVNFDEILQLCNNVPNAEHITPAEITMVGMCL